MNNNNIPSRIRRVYSVWFRHVKVYSSSLVSNALPPFLEPLIFLAGVGIGFGRLVPAMDGLSYLAFLATGLVITSPMYTASFECTYGTFIRMEYDKSYDSMLSTPISFTDLIIGELLWAGSKGFFFSAAVLLMMYLAGVISPGLNLLTPFVGFLTGMMFGSISLLVTSFVTNINHFNFYFTGLLSPMFFFSGVVFSISSLPKWAQSIAECFPLTHPVRLARFLELPVWHNLLLIDLAYIIIITAICGLLARKRLHKRIIN